MEDGTKSRPDVRVLLLFEEKAAARKFVWFPVHRGPCQLFPYVFTRKHPTLQVKVGKGKVRKALL